MKIWVWWLSILAIFIFLTGLLLTLLGLNNLVFSFDSGFFSTFYSLLPKPSLGIRLWWIFIIYGITSIAGGGFLFYVSVIPFKKVEKWAWLAVFITVMIWFTIGACISILFLIYVDLIIYSSVLVLTLLPLLFTQKAFIIRRDIV